MAVNFSQNPGFSQTVLGYDFLTPPTLPFSFACWFKPAVPWTASDKTLGTWAVPGGAGDGIRLDLTAVVDNPPSGIGGSDTGSVQADLNDFVFTEGSDAASFSFYSWNHGAAVFDGSGAIGSNPPTSVTGYVNGVAGTPVAPATLSPDNCRWFYIGGRGPGLTSSQGYSGCIAHFAAWNIALSAAQVALLAGGTLPNDHATLGTVAGNLVFYLPLADEATATTNLAGADFMLYEDPPTGVIATCVDGPTVDGGDQLSSYNRIFGC